VKIIPLSQGKRALVDDADYEYLSQWKWCFGAGYAVRTDRTGREKSVRMHLVIMNAPQGMEVDHRDGNGLNNQRHNLRLCTSTQNKHNRRPFKNNPTGYKGVYLFQGKYWRAKIAINKKQIHLGQFKTAIEAARAYDAAARKYFGEFAWLNFPD
jgi:hypothetical protein